MHNVLEVVVEGPYRESSSAVHINCVYQQSNGRTFARMGATTLRLVTSHNFYLKVSSGAVPLMTVDSQIAGFLRSTRPRFAHSCDMPASNFAAISLTDSNSFDDYT